MCNQDSSFTRISPILGVSLILILLLGCDGLEKKKPSNPNAFSDGRVTIQPFDSGTSLKDFRITHFNINEVIGGKTTGTYQLLPKSKNSKTAKLLVWGEDKKLIKPEGNLLSPKTNKRIRYAYALKTTSANPTITVAFLPNPKSKKTRKIVLVFFKKLLKEKNIESIIGESCDYARCLGPKAGKSLVKPLIKYSSEGRIDTFRSRCAATAFELSSFKKIKFIDRFLENQACRWRFCEFIRGYNKMPAKVLTKIKKALSGKGEKNDMESLLSANQYNYLALKNSSYLKKVLVPILCRYGSRDQKLRFHNALKKKKIDIPQLKNKSGGKL